MDNLKNVRISMFDRSNNSSQPVNVVTSANAVIVDGEEKNIKEYVDSNNLINTHISPKVDFGKYTTESDLFGENINEVVSEFIQHYTGGGSPSNQPPVGPAPTLPMPGLTPAAATTVPVEFTKRVEALETKLAAIESKGASTSSTKPASELMFDCIEDIFPLQLDYDTFYSKEYRYNKCFKKSNILIVPEQYYFNNDGGRWWKKEKKQPMLCIKFKDDVPYDKKNEIMSALKVELYVKTGSSFSSGRITYKYNRYLYDISNGMNSFGTNVDSIGGASDPQKILDDNGKEIGRNFGLIRLTNKELDESTSEFKYNESYIYTSHLNDSDVVEGVENGNIVISLKDNPNVYKRFVKTSIVPQIYTEFSDKYHNTLSIIEYEKQTKERNTEFIDKFFKDSYNPRDIEIPENLLFDHDGLRLPNDDDKIIGDNYNTFVEDIGSSYRIHYLVINNIDQGVKTNSAIEFAIAMSNTIKAYRALDTDSPAKTFKTIVNGTPINIFDRAVSASLAAGFQIPQRPIITRNGVFFVYGANKVNYDQIETVEFTVDLPKNPTIMTGRPTSLRQMPNNRFKERVTTGEDHL